MGKAIRTFQSQLFEVQQLLSTSLVLLLAVRAFGECEQLSLRRILLRNRAIKPRSRARVRASNAVRGGRRPEGWRSAAVWAGFVVLVVLVSPLYGGGVRSTRPHSC